jgi:head-tail adaptor
MYAGKLDRFIDIQHATETQSPSGAPVLTWQTIASKRPASVERRRDPVESAGRDFQVMALNQYVFRIRYSDDVAGITVKDRIIYPSSAPATPQSAAVYNVLAVTEIGRREGLQIIGEAYSDAG